MTPSPWERLQTYLLGSPIDWVALTAALALEAITVAGVVLVVLISMEVL